jgi:hypothetical protein
MLNQACDEWFVECGDDSREQFGPLGGNVHYSFDLGYVCVEVPSFVMGEPIRLVLSVDVPVAATRLVGRIMRGFLVTQVRVFEHDARAESEAGGAVAEVTPTTPSRSPTNTTSSATSATTTIAAQKEGWDRIILEPVATPGFAFGETTCGVAPIPACPPKCS